MVKRRGVAGIGCLGWILIVAIVSYVGLAVSAPYMRFYRFRDAVDQQVHYATFRSDDAIRKELWAAADSIGLPEPAYHVNVERSTGGIRIFAEYDDQWRLAEYVHYVHFTIDRVGTI